MGAKANTKRELPETVSKTSQESQAKARIKGTAAGSSLLYVENAKTHADTLHVMTKCRVDARKQPPFYTAADSSSARLRKDIFTFHESLLAIKIRMQAPITDTIMPPIRPDP